MLKSAVIGVGNMGQNHVRVQARSECVDLTAIADANEETAKRVARPYRLKTYADYRQLLDTEKPDLVCIALPTEYHAEAACEAMSRGIHVLVEKPIAPTQAEGRRMVQEADRNNVKLMVGHIERFNPALRAVQEGLAADSLGKLFQLHSRRLSPFPPRIRDVGVVLDLATHEIDAMTALLGHDVDRVFAEIVFKTNNVHEDMLSGLLRFASGVVGVLDVNWLTPTKVRQMSILGERGMYLVDYLTQDVYHYKNGVNGGKESWDSLAVFRGVSEGEMIKMRFPKTEPLQAELDSFVDAILEDKEPEVSGMDGLRTLALAESILLSGTRNAPVQPANNEKFTCLR